MIQIVNSSEELELYTTYCITIKGDVGDADQLRRDLEKTLVLVGWDPYLEHFCEQMYRWNGLWKYSLGHYVKIEYPSETALCAVLNDFWETHLLSHQDIEEIELEESHRVRKGTHSL